MKGEITFRGIPVSELTREELLEALRVMAALNEEARKHKDAVIANYQAWTRSRRSAAGFGRRS